MNAPLVGLTVVALEQAVAAPFCTARLADAGARVIKIERPEGDFARFYDNATPAGSSYFVWLNRGKESVVLDLRQQGSRQKLTTLVAQADILVQNLKPGAMDRLGLPLERLSLDHPHLICCSISGYGEEGPLKTRKAYDLLIQAESGLASITGSPDAPSRVGISIVDIATGATAHAAILEALITRGQTGQGVSISISMFDVMADWLAVPLINTEAGKPPQRVGLNHPSIAPYGLFVSRDGAQILISIQSDREWMVFCERVLQLPGMVGDRRFTTNVLRVQHRQLIDETVACIFVALNTDILFDRLQSADIAFAKLNDIRDLSQHPHLRRMTVATAEGLVSYPAPAPIWDQGQRQYGGVPALGAHTETVLRSLEQKVNYE